MSKYIFILGKDSALSLAELKAVYSQVESFGPEFAVVESEKELGQSDLDRLGGVVKMARFLSEVSKNQLEDMLVEVLEGFHSGSKLNYGLSLYGLSERNLRTFLIGLKKAFQKRDLSARFANQDFKNISTAQHKGLSKKGVELAIFKVGERFWVGEVTAVQDIDAYSKRDYDKPFRSMKVGMLPPKLAQVMINLAGVKKGDTIWDPFCGGGVLLMEGLLMGHPMMGSDINEETLEGADANIDWLRKEFDLKGRVDLFAHDATRTLERGEIEKVDAIVCEGYLGPPQTRLRQAREFEPLVAELTTLYVHFFEALKEAHFKGPVVLGMPFFRATGGREVSLDRAMRLIKSMGFHSKNSLKYARVDQLVGREIRVFLASAQDASFRN